MVKQPWVVESVDGVSLQGWDVKCRWKMKASVRTGLWRSLWDVPLRLNPRLGSSSSPRLVWLVVTRRCVSCKLSSATMSSTRSRGV
eukprot:5604028-Amphidinium_carterae.2